MAVLFADSFDPYGSLADMQTRWGTIAPSASDKLLATTAFSAGQALGIQANSNGAYTASWASNETTVFFSLRVQVASTGSATTYASVQFTESGTAQTTLRFNTDGSIAVYSGGPTGTLLGSIAAGTFPVGIWNSFQGKVVINNTTGSFELRANGAASDLLNLTNVNTRAGTTNAYANGLKLVGSSQSSNIVVGFDDLFVNSASGAAPNSWPGDLCAAQQSPATSVQNQFTPNVTTAFAQGSAANSSTFSASANVARWIKLTAPITGPLTSLSVSLSAAATGHAKMAIYDALGVSGGPGGLLATSAEIVNPVSGVNTFAVSAGPTLINKRSYWIGILSDVPLSIYGGTSAGVDTLAAPYASGFPAFAPGFSKTTVNGFNSCAMTLTPSNASLIGDLTEDADTSFVASGTVGAEDIYMLTPIQPGFSVVAVNLFVMWKKTDAGARTARLSIATNGSADTAEITNAALSNTYVFNQQMLTLDPTGAAWTPTSVNAAKLGVAVIA